MLPQSCLCLTMLAILIFACCTSTLDARYLFHGQKSDDSKPLMSVIDAIAKGVLLRHHCVTFIVDTHYHRVLDLNWTRRFSHVAIYMIVVKEDDDFFPPEDHFDELLRASRSTDCSAYIFLNKNGLQVSRLLQYGEKKRLFNTRGDFILLHDYKIFNASLNYIWDRIVNVIFIRRYNSASRYSGEKASMEWFDLNTVPFPYSNEGEFNERYIDTWYRGRFRYKNEHYPDKSKNLFNQSLRVAVFPHIPAITEHVKPRYEDSLAEKSVPLGIEFELLRILSRAMNFWPTTYILPQLDINKLRILANYENNTDSSTEIISNGTAFFLGDLYYTNEHLELVDLSTPYNTECLTFLTPESLNDNSWKILIMPFKGYLWLAVLATLFLGGLIFYRFAKFYKQTISLYKKKTTPKNIKTVKVVKRGSNSGSRIKGLFIFTEFQNSILYTYGMLLSISLPRLPVAWALRIFIGWWWLYSILVTVAYRASMTAILANPMSRVTIDTLSELARSQIGVGGWKEEMRDFFLSSQDTDPQKIGERFEVIKDDDEAVARVATGKFAYYENKYYLRHARAKRQILNAAQKSDAVKHRDPVTADRILHIMSECVIHMPISLGMDKNSLLKRRVDILVRRVTESGFIQKWLSDTMQWTINSERPQEYNSSKGLINLRKLYGALVALSVGYLAAFIALAGEIFHWKYIVQRHPDYDKYYLDKFYGQYK